MSHRFIILPSYVRRDLKHETTDRQNLLCRNGSFTVTKRGGGSESEHIFTARNEVGARLCFYRPQRSWAKVIFSQACVKNSVHRGGRGCLPQCTLGYPPGSRHPPRADIPLQDQTPPGADTPPGSRFQHMVYEQLVHILLECILVTGVCDSVHRGGVPDQVHPPDQVNPPGPGTPPWDQVHPPGPGTPPRPGIPPWDQVYPPWDQVPPTLGTPPGPGTPQTRYTPLDQVHPRARYTPRTRYTPQTRYGPLGPGTPPLGPGTPPDQVHPLGPGTPLTRYTPRTRYPPGPGTPPPLGPGRYGLRAGGTHPTGMQSC